MANPLASLKGATKLAQIAKIMSGIKNYQAANTQGLGPTGNTGGGGVSAPVSTLAGLPQSPLLQTLIKNGLITEGMPPEQALAVLKFAQMREGVPVDIAELMKQVSGDYEKYTGDILTSGQDWLNELMGTAYDPNDPNAAQFANDPIFSEYAGGMAQLDEVADANLATDLAWFRKQQSAQEQYYNDMMGAVSTGTLPVGAAAAGGGGGGGGGGYGGGGGGSGGGDSEWGDTKVTNKHDESFVQQEQDVRYWNSPGFRENFLAAIPEIAARHGITDPVLVAQFADRAESLINLEGSNPEEVLAAVEEEILDIDTKTGVYEDVAAAQGVWAAQAPDELQEVLREYKNLTGLQLGDDPTTPDEEAFYRIPTVDDPTTEEDESAILPPVLTLAQEERAGNIESYLDEAIRNAAGGDVGNPEQVSNIVNQLTYMSQLAKQRFASNPEEFELGSLEESLMGAGRNATTSAAGTGTPTPGGQPATSQYDVLSSILPGQVPSGGVIPESGGIFPVRPQRDPEAPVGPSGIPANDPRILNTSEWIEDPNQWNPYAPTDELTAVPGADQVDPLAAGLSPTQRYQASGRSPEDILEGFRNLVARNRDPGPQPGDLPDENGVSHYNVTLPPVDVPSGMEIDPVTGEVQPTEAGRTAYEEAMGPRIRGVNFEAGGSPLNTEATGASFLTGPVVQALAQMRLTNPQQGNDPIDTILQGIQNMSPQAPTGNMSIDNKLTIPPDVLEYVRTANANARAEELEGQFEDWGYNEEDRQAAQVTNPDAIREKYIRRLAHAPSWGGGFKEELTGPILEALQQRSHSNFIDKYGEAYGADMSLAPNDGRYWVPQTEWNEDEYRENQAIAEMLPTLEDFINRPGGENPDAGPATVYSKGTDTVRVSDAQNASANTYVDPEEGLPYTIPWDETSPVEDEPDTTLSMGAFGQMPGLRGNIRPTPTKTVGLDVPTMLARSAQNMLAARQQPAAQPTGGSWGGGSKPAYKPTTNPNIAKAAQAVKGASALANILKKFKR